MFTLKGPLKYVNISMAHQSKKNEEGILLNNNKYTYALQIYFRGFNLNGDPSSVVMCAA